MGRYVRFRAGNGRFRRGSLERDFGIKAWACAACRRFIPLSPSDPRPETCPHCGKPFVDLYESAAPVAVDPPDLGVAEKKGGKGE